MCAEPAMKSRDTLLDKLGLWLADRLRSPSSGYKPYTPSDPETLQATLKPGDVLLIEGDQKVSAAIKYLTQSTWSHAALYIGDALGQTNEAGEALCLVEVNLGEGCVASPLSRYQTYNTRICRAVSMSEPDRQAVVRFMVEHLGTKYDLKNIFDLLRYFLPTPPVPIRWRRRMLSFGSGDPTRAICSTLIAEAFQAIRYPILPSVSEHEGVARAGSLYARGEILHIRHHSLFAPRDFDLSPFFAIIKPTIEHGFDHTNLIWGQPGTLEADPLSPPVQDADPGNKIQTDGQQDEKAEAKGENKAP